MRLFQFMSMSESNRDLHGIAPDKSAVALLLIDVINDLEFPEGDESRHSPGRRIEIQRSEN